MPLNETEVEKIGDFRNSSRRISETVQYMTSCYQSLCHILRSKIANSYLAQSHLTPRRRPHEPF